MIAKDDAALLDLGRELQKAGYRFTTTTPLSHGRVLARSHDPLRASLRDIFGWSLPFVWESLPAPLFRLLDSAGALVAADGLFRSSVRFSTLRAGAHELLLAHSAYPTADSDAVFFGPDTYRFARAIAETSALHPDVAPKVILDIGTGTGAGGLAASLLFGGVPEILLTDINPRALRFSAINATLNGFALAQTRESDVLSNVSETPDLILANPPYLVDKSARAYRHGGGDWGTALSLRILDAALGRLPPGGLLILYTGAPIVAGDDMFFRDARFLLERGDVSSRYAEMDPDVFGEELNTAPYDVADRIAAVALIVRKAPGVLESGARHAT